jgi:hypothetical protein
MIVALHSNRDYTDTIQVINQLTLSLKDYADEPDPITCLSRTEVFLQLLLEAVGRICQAILALKMDRPGLGWGGGSEHGYYLLEMISSH